MLAPPTATSPATTACTTFTPESKFWMVTSSACCLKNPISCAITTSTFAKLVFPVGSPSLSVAGARTRSWAAAALGETNVVRPPDGVLPHTTARMLSTMPTPIVRRCCMGILLSLGLTPGCKVRFSHFQQSRRDHAERHEDHHRDKDARGLKRMGIRDNQVSQARNGRVEL